MRSLPALPHAGDRAGAPSAPVPPATPASSGAQPFLLHGPAPQLLQEAGAFLSEVLGPRTACLQDRLRLPHPLFRVPLFGRALEAPGGLQLFFQAGQLLLEPARALVCHSYPLLSLAASYARSR